MAQVIEYYKGFAIQGTLDHLEGLLAPKVQELARCCPQSKKVSIDGTSVGAIWAVSCRFEYEVQRGIMDVCSDAEGGGERKGTKQKAKEDVRVELCSRLWVLAEVRSVEGIRMR